MSQAESNLSSPSQCSTGQESLDNRTEEQRKSNSIGIPSSARLRMLIKASAEDFLEAQAQGTTSLYGQLHDPESGKGYAGEFARWCKAKPNTIFNGVPTTKDKEVYDIVRASDPIVYEYFKHHFLKRKQYNRRTKAYTTNRQHSASAIDNCLKALKKMYKYQAKMWEAGPKNFEEIVGMEPNHDGSIKKLKNVYLRASVAERRKKHYPRGFGSLAMEGYTDEQNQQLCDFGLTNKSLQSNDFTNMTTASIRSVHTHHVLATNLVLRFDDRQPLQWAQFCMQEPPDRMTERGNQLLTCVLEKRKMNQYGDHETVSSLRHLTNPLRCTWFALTYELFSQIHIDGKPFNLEDFVPEPNLDENGIHDGTYYHKWYDRYVFTGNTKCSRGKSSQPDAYKECQYATVLKYFKNVYNQVTPPIVTYHKLHLQRGDSVRKAEKEGVDTHQIGSHGGWNLRDALYQHYLTGVPMDMIRHLAGYPPKLPSDKPVPLIRRSVVRPPESLVKKVFPFIDEMQTYREASPDKFPASECGALEGFLRFTKEAAAYFLQDCAVMYEDMSGHIIFSTPALSCLEFFNFRDQLLSEMDSLVEETLDSYNNKDSSECLKIMKKLYLLACAWGGRFMQCKVDDQDLQEIIEGLKKPLLKTSRKRKGKYL